MDQRSKSQTRGACRLTEMMSSRKDDWTLRSTFQEVVDSGNEKTSSIFNGNKQVCETYQHSVEISSSSWQLEDSPSLRHSLPTSSRMTRLRLVDIAIARWRRPSSRVKELPSLATDSSCLIRVKTTSKHGCGQHPLLPSRSRFVKINSAHSCRRLPALRVLLEQSFRTGTNSFDDRRKSSVSAREFLRLK